MTTQIVLLGGSGYIGTHLIKQWRHQELDTEFWIVSRSGRVPLQVSNVHGIAADLTKQMAQINGLPKKIDYIVDLVGGPLKDPLALIAFNRVPAQLMKQLAEQRHVKAMGFIGGTLGPKSFVNIKHSIISDLRASKISLAVVEPTLVYGGGRKDQMTRWVPMLRALGSVLPWLKPVSVDEVVNTLITRLLTTNEGRKV